MTRPSVFVPIPAPGSNDWKQPHEDAISGSSEAEDETARQEVPETLPDPTEALIQANRAGSGWKTLELPLVQHRLFPERYQAHRLEAQGEANRADPEAPPPGSVPTWGTLPSTFPEVQPGRSVDSWGFLPNPPPVPPRAQRREVWGIPVHTQQEAHEPPRIEAREPIRKAQEPRRAQWIETLESSQRAPEPCRAPEIEMLELEQPIELPAPRIERREPPRLPGIVNLATELVGSSQVSTLSEPREGRQGRPSAGPLSRTGGIPSGSVAPQKGARWPVAGAFGGMSAMHPGLGFPALPHGPQLSTMSSRHFVPYAPTRSSRVRHQTPWPPRRGLSPVAVGLLWMGIIFTLLVVLAVRQMPETAMESMKAVILRQVPELRPWMQQR